MADTVEGFCNEFRNALLAIAAQPPGSLAQNNWFGRLLAWQYQMELDESTMDEITIKDQLA